MKAQTSPVDRVMETLAPVRLASLGDGKYRVDFGQQIAGWLHLLNVSGERGRKISIKYICESPVGDNSYTLKGGGPESYAARFSWFVFKEVEISNWPGVLKPEQLRAEVVHTNVENTGKFKCSDTLFNKIHQMWVRSQMDNMHGGIASDCPHRERSPYTGDGQVACITVMHNFDARAFYAKWIQDILGAQNPETGYVPNGAPWQPGCGGGVAWGAAISIMPWEFYVHYGDKDLLSRNYEGMKGYIKYMLTWTDNNGIMYSQAPDSTKANIWLNLGEWAAPGKLPPANLVHTFYLWECADITSKTAGVLGNIAEAKKYAELAEKTKRAFQNKFYDKEKGTYGPYGGNIFALEMGVPDDQKARVIAVLKADIVANGGHLDTGMFGTQFFFEVLAQNGMQDIAYQVMNQTTAPSYGWWIKQGATTTWEQWDGSGSHDHPMFGGGIVWFYRVLAGMNSEPDKPGYLNIIFKPQPAGCITFASYSNETPNGLASIDWEKNAHTFNLNITVPIGSTATVYVPASNANHVTESGKKIVNGNNLRFQRAEEGYLIYTVRSGTYSFQVVG
jgi:alpha-L-rhamnosidase